MNANEVSQVEIEFDDFGFVKNYVCPHCRSPVKFDHTDDIGTKFFRCERCGQQSTKLKSAERIKLDEDLAIETTWLHPSGGITDHFVYEPLGDGRYVYHTKRGSKGIAEMRVEYEDPKKKKEEKFYLYIEGIQFYFLGKPPKKFLFDFPDHEVIEEWVEGKKQSKSLSEIWSLTDIYYRTFLDFPHPHEFSVATLFVLQTWLSELLPVVFYLMVKGEFGGGKSVTCEAICAICRHGYETGNLSPPFVARTIETQKLTLYVDELDSVAGRKDSDLYSIFRQGYRRGGAYSRVNPDSLEPESFNIFGTKLYTVHTEIEQALQTRTIPLHVRETADYSFSIVNPEKTAFAKRLRTDFFLWYLDNALKLQNNQLEKIEVVNLDNGNQLAPLDSLDICDKEVNIDEVASNIRKTIFDRKITLLKNGQISQVQQVSGRNVELAYLCFVLSNIVGIDIDDDIVQTFTQKIVEEGERSEIGYLGTLKDVLTETYNEKRTDKDYQTASGEIAISNKELYALFNKKLMEEKLEGVSPHKFKEYLIEFGFTDALNRKKLEVPIPGGEKQSRLCNLFTQRVLRKLDLGNEPAPHPTLRETLEKLRTWLLENRDNDSRVEKIGLAEECKGLETEPLRMMKLLQEEGWIVDDPEQVGKWRLLI